MDDDDTLHPAFALLESLYDRQAEDVYRFLLGMLGRREDAEDGVQAIWLKLAEKPDRLERIRDLPAYLWTAVRHHARSKLRRRALERLWTPELESDEEEMLPAADNPGVPADELRDVARAVRRLAPKLRRVVLLVGFAGCTLDETSHRLGIPRGTAASRYRTAVARLRTWLDLGDGR